MTRNAAKSWPISCPECGDRTLIDLPSELESGHTGEAECTGGHRFMFWFDGETLEPLGALTGKG